MPFLRSTRARLAPIVVGALILTGCGAGVPDPPAAVGDGYPGTCLPGELSWPTDFLESLPSESDAVGGAVVGLRLEYVDARWVWRIRSADAKSDALGERVDDPGFGRESVVDVRTLETIATRQVELTAAEQTTGAGAYAVAQDSGEQWPSPLIIEMARVEDAGATRWRVTTCDTATNEHSTFLTG